MAAAKPTTVEAYLASLDYERRSAVETICATIRAHLHPDFEEGIQYGMVGYYLPHSIYPDGYHANPKEPLPLAAVASQKHHIGLYLFCIYTSPELLDWFTAAWKATGCRLDMGKSCVRVKSLEQVPLPLLGELFDRITPQAFIATYEAARPARRRTAKKTGTKKAVAKKVGGRRAG